MEEKFWELREEMERADDRYHAYPTSQNFIKRELAYSEYAVFCIELLEKLMDENVDVLLRLKNSA